MEVNRVPAGVEVHKGIAARVVFRGCSFYEVHILCLVWDYAFSAMRMTRHHEESSRSGRQYILESVPILFVEDEGGACHVSEGGLPGNWMVTHHNGGHIGIIRGRPAKLRELGQPYLSVGRI